MNPLRISLIVVSLAVTAMAQEPTNSQPPAVESTNVTVTTVEPMNENALRLNFRGAPLEMVLDYLSKAAGFTIVLETDVKGKVDVWNDRPLTKEEAVTVLDAALNRNGYSAVRNGRTLTIMSRDDAKRRNIPVTPGADPAAIPITDAMVTQIIPVRYANVTQLTKDLQPLLPSYAVLTANESANALVLTDTQANVRRMVEIVKALDTSVSNVSTVRVFPLRFADSKALAETIKELFEPASNNQQQAFNQRNFFRGFGGGGFGGPPGGQPAAEASAQRVTPKVAAVADEHSNSVVVSAPDEFMPTIEQLIREVDVSVADRTELRAFHLDNADPTELADQLTTLFPDPTKTTQSQGQNPQYFFNGGRGFPGGMNNAANNAQSAASDRQKKASLVVAVPDQRTSSLIVSAASDLMPQIAAMIEQLDHNPAMKKKVYVVPLENAEVTDVLPVLQDMFNKNTTSSKNSSSSQNDQNNALTSRATRNNSTATTSSTTGSGMRGGGGAAGGTGGGF